MSAPLLTLGDRLRWAREYAGLSAGQVKAASHLAKLDRWETGAEAPPPEIVERLSALYAIDRGWLLTGRERADDADTVRALQRSRVSEHDAGEVLTYLRRVRVDRG